MRKLHRAGAAVAALSLVLTVSAFTREGMRSAVAGSPGPGSSGAASPGPASPGGPMIVAGHTGPAVSSRPGHTVIHSLNWAGYAGNRAGTTFRYVSAVFAVPYVDCTGGTTSYSSHWVGLDGLGSASVEQVGIEADCAGSTPRYYAWYEMYPKPVTVVFAVGAGNAVQASVTYKKPNGKFVLMLRDTSDGRHFTRTLKCAAKACLRSSAEVISEAPSNGSGGILPLTDYRAEGFSGITLTTSRGHRSGLSSRNWKTYQIIGVGDSSHDLSAQPTSLFQGQAFSNYWFRPS
jgi:Peptidase A4 family